MSASHCVRLAALSLGLGFAAGCKEDPPPPPPPPPTIWELSVVDAATLQPIAGARVLLDGVWQATDGSGVLSLEHEPETFAYSVEAAGHHPFPDPFQPEQKVTLPKEKTTRSKVALDARTVRGPGKIRGTVKIGAVPAEGALVIASAAEEGYARTDAEGVFEISDLSPSNYLLTAFLAGHTGTPKTGVVVDGATPVEGVELALTAGAAGRLDHAATSTLSGLTVWLTHPRLGVPIPGLSGPLGSARGALQGVPNGTFTARAGLELDGFVLDPEPIRADGPLDLAFPGSPAPTLDLVFVRAMTGLSPAQTSSVSATPMFRFDPVPGADFYVVQLLDLEGKTIWGGFDAVGSPQTRLFNTQVMYGGPALSPGARYRWRVFAGKNDLIVTSQFTLIAASEELGAFIRIQR